MALLDSLSDSARIAYPFILRGVREGLSARGVGRAIRGAGLRLADHTLRLVYNAELEIWRYGQSLRYLNFNMAANVARMPVALTTIRREYSFTVQVDGVLQATQERQRVFVTVSSDINLIRKEVEATAQLAVEGSREVYGMEVDRVLYVSALKAGAGGIF